MAELNTRFPLPKFVFAEQSHAGIERKKIKEK